MCPFVKTPTKLATEQSVTVRGWDERTPVDIHTTESVTSQTCYVEFDLQRDLIGQRRVSEQLIGLLQCSVLCGDSVDWQQPVSNLQQATPTTEVTTVMSEEIGNTGYLLYVYS